jgi:phosphate transport system substrate-binding protein
MPKILQRALALSALCVLALPGCGNDTRGGSGLGGAVRIDGSSTVFPISEAVAEEFRAVEPGVRVTVGVSGTGGGFKKFSVGEIDVGDASRPIKAREADAARANGVAFIELPVAFDGLAVVANPKNEFVDHLTLEELKRIWQPDSAVRTWRDVRPTWPDRAIRLYGPGTDSGTFDYFTKAVVGKERSCRPDFTASEDDNILVRGIAGDLDGLGYFGYAA